LKFSIVAIALVFLLHGFQAGHVRRTALPDSLDGKFEGARELNCLVRPSNLIPLLSLISSAEVKSNFGALCEIHPKDGKNIRLFESRIPKLVESLISEIGILRTA
jgi:hypothetical protein